MDRNNSLCDPACDFSESHSLRTLVNEAGLLPGEGNGVFFITTVNFVAAFLKGTKEKSFLGLPPVQKLPFLLPLCHQCLPIWAGVPFW